MPKLTDADDDYLSALKIKALVDLRSVDERQLSPVDWRAKPNAEYLAVDYPGDVLFDRLRGYDGPDREQITERLYAALPALLRQEYKAVFRDLLSRHVPVVICGGAGQDRTGITVGLILSALGTPRQIIYEDYLLSAADRTPANELPTSTCKTMPRPTPRRDFSLRTAITRRICVAATRARARHSRSGIQ